MALSITVLLSFLIGVAFAQSGLNTSMCVANSGVTSFSNCDTLVTNVYKCNSTTSQTDFDSCFCTQDFFNEVFDNRLPSLTHLIFRDKFNQNVDNLPSNLIYLKFGVNFNQPVDNLPQKLKYLYFSFP